MKNILLKFGLPALTLFTFFFLLGNRPLNEPDEGRYSEIAREMIETGGWLVPHFWYLPHLDKPPMTYWLVAASMKIFGQNEWAVRLPVALAGVSGVWATFLLGCAMGGRRVGLWSALILQSATLYLIQARMLTTDIFLTQFIAWAVYFFWRSWTAMGKGEFFAWHLAAWVAIAGGFLTKGPVALIIPVISFKALLIARRERISKTVVGGLIAGFILFLILVAPWFLAVFSRVPESAHYMILGQAAGHFLGTTIKNRVGIPGYFIWILAGGLLPWSLLLGWLWRRTHWRSLEHAAKGGWLLLNVWAIFTFILFSLSHAKLPAYILPIFPALAVMLAWRFFGGYRTEEAVPNIVWRIGLAISLLLPAILPLLVFLFLHETLPLWIKFQAPVVVATLIVVFLQARKWRPEKIAACSVSFALLGFFISVAEFPLFDFNFKSNQPLNEIGNALRENYRPGDAIVCMGKFPQGLPFYSGGVILATNRAYFYSMDLKQVPFEFPGNLERLENDKLYLADPDALLVLLNENRGVFVLGFGTGVEMFQKKYGGPPLQVVAGSGQWVLYYSNHNHAPENGGNP